MNKLIGLALFLPVFGCQTAEKAVELAPVVVPPLVEAAPVLDAAFKLPPGTTEAGTYLVLRGLEFAVQWYRGRKSK